MEAFSFNSAPAQEVIAAGIVFALGVFVRSRINWGKTNNATLEMLDRDFKALKTMYDVKCDEVKKKDDVIVTLQNQVGEKQARVTSYENFLQSRTFESEATLRKVGSLLPYMAERLGIELPEEGGVRAADTAHSQTKFDANTSI